MRAVIIGTDFVKDTDGTYKALETNSNISLNFRANTFLDSDSILQFLSNNGLTKLHFIHPNNTTTGHGFFVDKETQDQSEPQAGITKFLSDMCENANIEFIESVTDASSITVPVIEDEPNKLILRLSYDTTALIDDTYTRDNWEFLKLMYDSNPISIPATYINDTELGFDSIGTTLRDNGNHPNYCIKKRYTPSDNNIFPKLLKISTVEILNTIKSQLDVDEYLQEYIFNNNDLFEGKLKHYRSIDIIYGSELNTFNLLVQEISNVLELVDTPDYDNNNHVQIWDRIRYVNKWNYSDTNKVAVKLSADENTKILSSENQIKTIDELNEGDYVKSIDIASLPQWLEAENAITEWSSSLNDVLTNYTVTSSVIQTKNSFPYFGIIHEIELSNNSIFSDVGHAKILKQSEISGSTVVKFESYENIDINDIIVIWDNLENTFIISTVINKRYSIQNLNAYSLNIEDVDLFLTLEESFENRYALITHNYNYDCYLESCSKGQYIVGGLYMCSSGNVNAQCSSATLCYRCNGPGYPPCGLGAKCYMVSGKSCVQVGTASQDGYCNNSKSDKRLKKNIEYIETINGLKLYEFEFTDDAIKLEMEYCDKDISGRWKGVIAQDLEGTEWERYIITDINGNLCIDYNSLPIKLLKIN